MAEARQRSQIALSVSVKTPRPNFPRGCFTCGEKNRIQGINQSCGSLSSARGVISKYRRINEYYEEVGSRLAEMGREVTVYCRYFLAAAFEGI